MRKNIPVNMPTLCRFGIHKKRIRVNYFPNIHAEIVTEYHIMHYCSRCGKVFEVERKVWDGSDFFAKKD